MADAVIVRDGDAVLLVRPRARAPEKSLASTPIARLDLAKGERMLLGQGTAAVAAHATAVEEWKLLIAAALAGLAKEAIRIASDYACERIQFGRPIGSYQAISHPLANAIVEVDAGRIMVWRAIRAIIDGDADAGERVSIAAWWAGAAAEKAVAQALHTFGGYGLTLEYDIHLFNLRSRSLLLVLGDPEMLLEEAADRRYGGAVASLPEAGEMVVEFGLGEEAGRLRRKPGPFSMHFRRKPVAPWRTIPMPATFPRSTGNWPRPVCSCPHGPSGWAGAMPVLTHGRRRTRSGKRRLDHPCAGHGEYHRPMIDRFGTEQCKQDILAKIISGEIVCALGYSEPGSGSDVFAAKTRATRQADGSWRIDGQKMFTSGAEHSAYAILLARTDPDAAKHKGITMFMVPLQGQGVTIQEVKTFQGERTNITFYDGVAVSDAYRLGEVNGGLQVMALALEIEQGMSFGPYHRKCSTPPNGCWVGSGGAASRRWRTRRCGGV